MFLEVLGIIDIARSGNETGQQVVSPVRDESLSGGTVQVSGEVMSEEPGAERHLGVVHQGGVQ